jgi:hypothetical protein
MAAVTTVPTPEISSNIDRLEALYYEFDVSDDHYAVFENIKVEFRKAKLQNHIYPPRSRRFRTHCKAMFRRRKWKDRSGLDGWVNDRAAT